MADVGQFPKYGIALSAVTWQWICSRNRAKRVHLLTGIH